MPHPEYSPVLERHARYTCLQTTFPVKQATEHSADCTGWTLASRMHYIYAQHNVAQIAFVLRDASF